MGKEWDKLSRNLLNPTSEADIKRLEEYGDSYQGRISKLPDLSKLNEFRNEVQEWHKDWLREAHRVLKPGGIIKAFSATRTYHHLAMAMEDVGFTQLSIEAWCYGSGFPKSLNISKSIDKKLGKEREVQGYTTASPKGVQHAETRKGAAAGYGTPFESKTIPIQDKPASEEAALFDGYGTALKPSWEPFVVGVKQ